LCKRKGLAFHRERKKQPGTPTIVPPKKKKGDPIRKKRKKKKGISEKGGKEGPSFLPIRKTSPDQRHHYYQQKEKQVAWGGKKQRGVLRKGETTPLTLPKKKGLHSEKRAPPPFSKKKVGTRDARRKNLTKGKRKTIYQ